MEYETLSPRELCLLLKYGMKNSCFDEILVEEIKKRFQTLKMTIEKVESKNTKTPLKEAIVYGHRHGIVNTKIAAIKHIRNRFGIGLKEAKDVVDDAWKIIERDKE